MLLRQLGCLFSTGRRVALRGRQASLRSSEAGEGPIQYFMGPDGSIPSLRMVPLIDENFVESYAEIPRYKLLDYQRNLQSHLMMNIARPTELLQEDPEPVEMEVRSKRFEHAKRKRARRRYGKRIILQ